MTMDMQASALNIYNPFLQPVIERWNEAPESLVGKFFDGDDWVCLHQREFAKSCRSFASLLREAGVGPGQIVLIICRHGIDAYASFIGTMMIGGVPSFMPHPSTKQAAGLYWQQHKDIFSHTKPAAIIVHQDFQEAVAEAVAEMNIAVLPVHAAAVQPPFHPNAPPGGEAVALLQHSSGTTGLKKGVQLSYRSICQQLDSYRTALGLMEVHDPCIVSWLPLYHDMGLITSLLLPIWLGIPIISIDPFEWTARPSLFLEAIQDHRGTHAWLPNFAFLHQVRTAGRKARWNLESLVALISCSEPCKAASFDAFAERFAESGVCANQLQTCYAMAETVFAVTQSEIGKPVRRLDVDRDCISNLATVTAPRNGAERLTLLSNGKPINGCEVRILRDRFVGEHEIGEICVSAPFLFDGYYNNAGATAAAFQGNWFRTGDLGFLDQGEVFVVGRQKDVIIVNGKNVFAHDVEAVVSRVQGVKPGRVVALGIYDEAAGSERVVVVAERETAGVNVDALAACINRVVVEEAGVGCGDVQVVDQGWLVKTTSGKISRKDNLAKYLISKAEVAV